MRWNSVESKISSILEPEASILLKLKAWWYEIVLYEINPLWGSYI